MIGLDGYYRSKQSPYEDGIANSWDKGYFHNAYLFLSNGTYLKAVKKSKSEQVSFSEADFSLDFPNKYEIKEDEVIMTFETGTEWEFSEIYKIVDQQTLEGKDKTLKFFNW